MYYEMLQEFADYAGLNTYAVVGTCAVLAYIMLNGVVKLAKGVVAEKPVSEEAAKVLRRMDCTSDWKHLGDKLICNGLHVDCKTRTILLDPQDVTHIFSKSEKKQIFAKARQLTAAISAKKTADLRTRFSGYLSNNNA